MSFRLAMLASMLAVFIKPNSSYRSPLARKICSIQRISPVRSAGTCARGMTASNAFTRPNRRYFQSQLRMASVESEKTSVNTDLGASRSTCPPPNFKGEANEKYFEFARLEKDIYEWWEESGYFKPSADLKKKPFVIPMPPPNVTGYLHMGHAMFIALQDIMARFQRMRGKATLWLPGTDHAGIATQLLVERAIVAEGSTRLEMGREAFLKRVWEWKEEKGGYITVQMRRLGASADWTREKFTLEPAMSDSVTEAFVRMYEKGLIYKGDYLVNWSPNLMTAVSDLEVEYSEEMGKLYFFKYELADGSGNFIPVATTRPETILGDTAVCVHPEDDRYKAFVGKKVKVPMSGREIIVIADDYVDREFGTGALKITPAHDPNDYEIGKRFNLPLINIMNKDASINDKGGAYTGLDRFACREKLWSDMETAGLTIKVDPHLQRVPRSQRGGEVIEPMVSGQWFVKMDNMAERAVNAVRNKEITIIPDRFEKVWYNWLENIHDWCVSRQLWWGHRIPAYYVEGSDRSEYVIARSAEEAQRMSVEKWGKEGLKLVQDEDVLDTWFSSGLWPFATVGWPLGENDANSDLARFYPAAVLETGYDILFFWVARMVMMGLELTDKSPFHTIYMHGLVRDASGQKMSKTKGNVIDPLDVVDQFGSDALRYSLVTGSTPGQDVPLSMERIESNRNFVNKLWNAGKYLQNVLASVSEEEKSDLAGRGVIDAAELATLPPAERYIVSLCHRLVEDVTKALEGYNFGDAGRQIYEFLWDEYADWYIELSKTRMRDGGDITRAKASRRVLVYVWDTCLRLLHPFMPFLTEALWQLIPHKGESIMLADWPQLEDSASLPIDATAEAGFRSLQGLVRTIRNARNEYNVEAGRKIGALVRLSSSSPSSAVFAELLETEAVTFAMLARLEEKQLFIEISKDGAPITSSFEAAIGQSVHLIVEEGLEAFLPLAGMIDYVKERARLSKQAEKLKKDIEGLETRLTSKGFADKAPPNVIAEVRGTVTEKKEQLSAVEKSISDMEGK